MNSWTRLGIAAVCCLVLFHVLREQKNSAFVLDALKAVERISLSQYESLDSTDSASSDALVNRNHTSASATMKLESKELKKSIQPKLMIEDKPLLSNGTLHTRMEAAFNALDTKTYNPTMVEGKPWLNRTRPSRQSLISMCKNSGKPKRGCGINATITAQSRIIDYAILGFAKCGSTTVGSALGKFGQAPRGDTCSNVVNAIDKSYQGWPKQYGKQWPARKNQNILTGLKCPAGFEINSIISSWSQYQPDTLLIAGIRHPVLAFQSFFNMFVQNGFGLKDPYKVLPSCKNKQSCGDRGCPGNGILCADRVRYHVALAKLGKTSLSKAERALLPLNGAERPFSKPKRIPNKVFLYEVSQLTDTNQSRDELFWSDLSQALELPFAIHPQNITTVKPGKKNLSPTAQKKRDQRKLDVCDPKNDKLREVLMKYARQSADWFCPYFLQEGTGVIVSDKEYFCKTIMERWRQDPCDAVASEKR